MRTLSADCPIKDDQNILNEQFANIIADVCIILIESALTANASTEMYNA